MAAAPKNLDAGPYRPADAASPHRRTAANYADAAASDATAATRAHRPARARAPTGQRAAGGAPSCCRRSGSGERRPVPP